MHVTLRFDAPGGVETTVRELARRQRALGDDVEVYASDLFDEAGWVRRQDYRPTVDEVPVRRFGIVKRPFPRLTLPMMVGLVDALRESGADVVHAHSHRYGHVLQAAAVARRRSIPLVVSTHYHPADRRETPLKRGLLRLEDFAFGAAAYRTADALVVESRREAELVREFAPAGRIHVIPPGIDVAEWDAGAGDTSLVGDLPSRYLLFVGRIASNKGLPFLLEAYSRLDHGSAPELVLMGPDWGETARLGSLATRLGVRERTHFLGAVADRARYRAIVRRAAALVLPSEWEAFGLVLLEAMAAGTPVVATAVGAVPEVVEDGRAGRLVPYGDVGALAIALRAVDDDREETARRVAVGRARARSLDWSISVERQRALYRAVAPGAA